LRLSPRLKTLLGFKSEYVDSGIHKSTRGIDVDEIRQLLFIYCNVLDSRIVGDSFAPLLAVVYSQGRYGSVIHNITIGLAITTRKKRDSILLLCI